LCSCFVFLTLSQAKVRTAAALNSTYFTGGGPPSSSNNLHGWDSCGHVLLRILTAPSCFPTTSSSGTSTSRLHPALTCFITRCFSGTPQAKATTATALNFTYFTGGVPPSYSINPHCWQSCGHLLLRILTAASFFLLRLLQALPRLGYKPGLLVFQPRLPQALPRLKFQWTQT
jgi:hypothetical protein